MEIKLENIRTNDWEFSTELSSDSIIGITGPEYEELLEILRLETLPEGNITMNETVVTPENHLDYYKTISIIEKEFHKINLILWLCAGCKRKQQIKVFRIEVKS